MASPFPSLPFMYVTTRVMSVRRARTIRSNMVRQYSPAWALDTSRWNGAASVGRDGRLRDVEPRFEPGRPLLHVADGVEVLVEPGPVVGPQFPAEGVGVVVDGVEDAPPPVEPGPPGGGPAGLLPEKPVEDVPRVVLGRQGDAVPGERQGGGVAGLAGARN